MNLPRAIVGSIRCMARPRRPAEEGKAVCAAAAIVTQETGLTSARAVSREIAARVVSEFMRQLEADPVELAFAAIERDLLKSPFHNLASCPEINLAAEFLKLRIKRLEGRQGAYLSHPEQTSERASIDRELRALLAGRYDHALRK